MPLFPAEKFENILTPIDANVMRMLERFDAIAAAIAPEAEEPTAEEEESPS